MVGTWFESWAESSRAASMISLTRAAIAGASAESKDCGLRHSRSLKDPTRARELPTAMVMRVPSAGSGEGFRFWDSLVMGKGMRGGRMMGAFLGQMVYPVVSSICSGSPTADATLSI